MKVSVVIPTYNAAAFLPEALESVLSQSEAPTEVVVVDDGSTDHTPQLMKAYEGRVRYFRTERLGAGGARNLGINMTTGEQIAFLDADDYWLPDKLKLQRDFFRNHPEVEMVFTDAEAFQGEKVLLKSLKSDPAYRRAIGGDGVLTDAYLKILKTPFISMGSVMVKRDCLKRVGLFDSSLPVAEDRDLWLRIAYDAKIAFLPLVLMRVRKHERNISRDPVRGLQFEILAIKKQLPVSQKYRRETEAQLAHLYQRLAHHYLGQNKALEGRNAFREALRYHLAIRPSVYYLSSFISPVWNLLSTLKGKGSDNCASVPERLKRRLRSLLKFCYTCIDYYEVELDLLAWSPRFTRGNRFRVERITSDNLERLKRLFFREGEAMLADCLLPGYTGFAVLAGEQMIGYFRLGTGTLYVRELGLSVHLKQNEILVHGVYILPEYRGTGAVGFLFDAGLLFFKEKGYRTVFGQIDEKNQASLKFSRHFGFNPVRLMRSRQILSRYFQHQEKA